MRITVFDGRRPGDISSRNNPATLSASPSIKEIRTIKRDLHVARRNEFVDKLWLGAVAKNAETDAVMRGISENNPRPADVYTLLEQIPTAANPIPQSSAASASKPLPWWRMVLLLASVQNGSAKVFAGSLKQGDANFKLHPTSTPTPTLNKNSNLQRVQRAAESPRGTPLISITAPTTVTTDALPLAPTVSPGSVPAPSMATDWIDQIEWRAFDEVHFFNASGISVDTHAGLPGRLRAMFECFQPRPDHPSPLDIRQFDQTAVRNFVAGVMETIGEGAGAYGQASPVDPVFAQTLFNRWFLQLAAPRNGNNGDLRGDLFNAPFDQRLLRLIHPSSPDRRTCGSVQDTQAAPSLPRIGALKTTLLQEYLSGYARFDAGLPMEFAYKGICEIFEPTLLRKDLPETFRYGSLAWALLSIGIDLAGDAQSEMSTHALISLGAAADLFSGDMTDPGMAAIQYSALRTILRMAHAQGKIDLQHRHANREITRQDIETALNLFQSQFFAETNKLAPMEELVAAMPTRSQIAKDMLRERGIWDPEMKYEQIDGKSLLDRLNQMSPISERPCMPKKEGHALYKIFMSGCLKQLLSSATVSSHDRDLLNVPILTVDNLNARFEKSFDAKIGPLTHQIMMPTLQDEIAFMDVEDEKFWRCGEWTVRIPSAMIRTRRTAGSRHTGGVGAGGDNDPVERYKVRDNVLIRLTLEVDGQTHLRTYSVALEPFSIKRYEVNDKALLGRSLEQFFKPKKSAEKLLNLHRQSSLVYEDYTAGNSRGNLLQIVSERLMQHRTGVLRESARETTEPEAFRASVKKMLLDFLPLYACITAIQADERDDAKLYCTIDALSLIPVAAAGAKLTRAIFAVGRLSRKQIGNIAKAFLLRSVKPDDAHHAVSSVLALGKPAMGVARESVNLFDPGFQLLSGLNRMAFRLGAAGLQQLSKKISGIPELAVIAERLKDARQLLAKFYLEGDFWRTRPDAIFMQNGQRRVAIGDKHYGVYAIGEIDNIVAIQNGAEFRLLNPQSETGYGPLLRSGLAPKKLELAIRANNHQPVASGHTTFADVLARLAGLCRVRRAGDALPGACRLVVDTRFGAYGYARENPAPLINHQFRLTDASMSRSQFDMLVRSDIHDGPSRIRTVNVADLGYAVTRENAAGLQHIVPDAAARFVHTPGGASGAIGTPTLPQTLSGTIVHLPQAGSATGADYVSFAVEAIDSSGATVRINRYVPFGNYQEVDGTVIGIAYVDPVTPYYFSIDPAKIPLGGGDLAIVLRRPGTPQIQKFNHFQRMLYSDPLGATPGAASVTKLCDETDDVRAQFDMIFERGETILDSALAAMNNHPRVVARICAKLLGTQPDDAKLHKLLNAMWSRVVDIQHFMPYLKSQSPYVIGFFQARVGGNAPLVTGSAHMKSMTQEVNFRHIKQPLILFNRDYFMDCKVVQDRRAVTLLHEISHARASTEDRMNPAVSEAIYASYDHEKIVLSSIWDAASLLGSEPENHADTFAHATMMMAYLIEPDTLDLVKPFLKFSDSYTMAALNNDFDVLLGLLADIEFDRRKRAVHTNSD
jgi:hypothetical protein